MNTPIPALNAKHDQYVAQEQMVAPGHSPNNTQITDSCWTFED